MNSSDEDIVTTNNETSSTPHKQMNVPRIHPPYDFGNTSPYPTVVMVTITFQIEVQNTLKFWPETSDKGLSKIQSMCAKHIAETIRVMIKVLFGLSLN